MSLTTFCKVSISLNHWTPICLISLIHVSFDLIAVVCAFSVLKAR